MTDAPRWASPDEPRYDDGPAFGSPPGPAAPAPSAPPSPSPARWGGQGSSGQQWGGQQSSGQQWGGQPGWGPSPAARPDVKPGVVPLRPLALGELLDGAVSVVRAHPRATLGLAAAVVGISQLLQFLLLRGPLRRFEDIASAEVVELEDVLSVAGPLAVGGLLSALVSVLASIVLSGMVTAVVGRAVLGQPVSVADAWGTVRPLVLRLVGLSLLVVVTVGAVFVAGVVPGVLLLAAGAEGLGALLLVLGLLTGGAFAVRFYVSWALAGPALVLERQRVRPAMARSRVLVRGDWWRVFGILLLTFVIAGFLASVLQVPFNLFGGGGILAGLEGDTSPSLLAQVLSNVGAVVAGTLVGPFTAGVTALLYVDRRMRAEGLDVALMSAAGVAPGGPVGAPSDRAFPAPGAGGPGGA